MAQQPVTIKQKRTFSDRVVEIVLPGGRLSLSAARELAGAAETLSEDRSVAAIILSAVASDFCTGIDDDVDPYSFRPDPASALATLRPPIISVVEGACYDEGLELILATDIRLARTTSSFRLAQTSSGRLPCWGGTQRLSRCIRPGAAAGMTLTGSSIDGERASSLGLAHFVCETSDELATETRRIAGLLVDRGPLALELAKEAIHRGSELSLRDGLRLEGDLNHQLAATEDRAEGLAAFFDKRPPDFTGR